MYKEASLIEVLSYLTLQSSAATMAFNAQGGVFQQHLQALVNVPPGGQFTVQQACKFVFIVEHFYN